MIAKEISLLAVALALVASAGIFFSPRPASADPCHIVVPGKHGGDSIRSSANCTGGEPPTSTAGDHIPPKPNDPVYSDTGASPCPTKPKGPYEHQTHSNPGNPCSHGGG